MHLLSERGDVRARGTYACCRCGELINIGELHDVQKWSDGKRAFALRSHTPCRARWDELAAGMPRPPVWLGDFPGCKRCQGYLTTPAGEPCPRCSEAL